MQVDLGDSTRLFLLKVGIKHLHQLTISLRDIKPSNYSYYMLLVFMVGSGHVLRFTRKQHKPRNRTLYCCPSLFPQTPPPNDTGA